MKKAILIILAAVIFTVFFISCQKGNNTVVLTNTDLLTESAWKIIKYEQKINSSGTYADQFPTVAACSRDDLYKFATSNTYQITEGASKCNPSDPDLVFTGLWQFTQNETYLKMDNVEYFMNKLSDTMILSNYTVLAPDTTYNRITLVH